MPDIGSAAVRENTNEALRCSHDEKLHQLSNRDPRVPKPLNDFCLYSSRRQRSMSRCWTCRRRRLKCDGGVPHCQKCISNGEECLGYTKPLTWVEGVARRGPMKNRSFGETGGKALVRSSPQQSPTSGSSSYGSPSPTLTEPLFQDLDDTSRFFVDYCEYAALPTDCH